MPGINGMQQVSKVPGILGSAESLQGARYIWGQQKVSRCQVYWGLQKVSKVPGILGSAESLQGARYIWGQQKASKVLTDLASILVMHAC